jgi:hypothetical protein
MEPLAVEVIELGAHLGARSSGDGIGGLGEPVASIEQDRHDGRSQPIAQLFANDPETELVVVVDEHQRPVGVHRRDRFERGERPLPAPLCVLAQARPADVAQRAMTRALPRRFDPVAVIDDLGRLVGVVRIERLVQALAAAA